MKTFAPAFSFVARLAILSRTIGVVSLLLMIVTSPRSFALDQDFETDALGFELEGTLTFIPAYPLFRTNRVADPGAVQGGELDAYEGDWYGEIQFYDETSRGGFAGTQNGLDRFVWNEAQLPGNGGGATPFIDRGGARIAVYIDDPAYLEDPDGIPGNSDDFEVYFENYGWYWYANGIDSTGSFVNRQGGFGVRLVDPEGNGNLVWRAGTTRGSNRGYEYIEDTDGGYEFQASGWFLFEILWIIDPVDQSVNQLNRIWDAGGNLVYSFEIDGVVTSPTVSGGIGSQGIGLANIPIAGTPLSGIPFLAIDAVEQVDATEFHLSMDAQPAIGGTVTGVGIFADGTDAPITATPEPGYSFAGWIGEGVADPNAATTTVSMTEDRTVTATFVLAPTCGDLTDKFAEVKLLTNGSLEIIYRDIPSGTYSVEYTTDLVGWTFLTDVSPDAGGVIRIEISSFPADAVWYHLCCGCP